MKNLKDFVLSFLKSFGKNQGLNVIEKRLSGLQSSDAMRLHQFKEKDACKTLSALLTFIPALSSFACICSLAFRFVFVNLIKY